MTWIVGTSSLFGYAAAVSDVQVTWPEGRHLDCLQKVYPAIPIVAFGFSGSVRIGSHLLEDFRRNFLRGLSGGQAPCSYLRTRLVPMALILTGAPGSLSRAR